VAQADDERDPSVFASEPPSGSVRRRTPVSRDGRARARVGTIVDGKWRLDALLGVGGVAAVYAATHRNGNRVAIKILHKALVGVAPIRDRFVREGYVANAVSHPGVVRVVDDGVTDDTPYLVMELVDGETLGARLARLGRIPVPEALVIAEKVLDVLAAAHGKGVLHRDVKPDNVMLCADGSVRLLDFGVARLREITSDQQITAATEMLGTPAFMAPEQARSEWKALDARSDLWAVGATLFAMLSGRTVHEGKREIETLIRAASKPAPPITSVEPSVPIVVAGLVDRALAFEPGARWPDADAMRAAVLDAYGRLELTDPSVVERRIVEETRRSGSSIPPVGPIITAEFDAPSIPAGVGRAPAPEEESTTRVKSSALTTRLPGWALPAIALAVVAAVAVVWWIAP
jgi:serine/threonine-protein kinase